MSTQPSFDHYAIVEIFGHVRLAGRVSEATIGGCQFVRVDIPETATQPAFTRMYGQGAIYSITLVSEEVARLAAERLQEKPLTIWMPQVRLLKDRVEVRQAEYSYQPADYGDDREDEE
jgi:hypothetical protein